MAPEGSPGHGGRGYGRETDREALPYDMQTGTVAIRL